MLHQQTPMLRMAMMTNIDVNQGNDFDLDSALGGE